MQTTPLLPAHAALFLDFDGTLIALAPTPEGIVLPSTIVPLLTDLHALLSGAVAVVSGRTLAMIDRHLMPLQLPVAAEHGAQRRDACGKVHAHHLPDGDAIAQACLALAGQHPGLLVERKQAAIALHYRQAPQLEALCRHTLQALVQGRPDLVLMQGKCVLEVLPAQVNKGHAIAAFLQQRPFVARMPVFVGDDTTDEAGFATVQALGGMAVKVGAGPSAARHRLESPAAVQAWLTAARDQLQARLHCELLS